MTRLKCYWFLVQRNNSKVLMSILVIYNGATCHTQVTFMNLLWMFIWNGNYPNDGKAGIGFSLYNLLWYFQDRSHGGDFCDCNLLRYCATVTEEFKGPQINRKYTEKNMFCLLVVSNLTIPARLTVNMYYYQWSPFRLSNHIHRH